MTQYSVFHQIILEICKKIIETKSVNDIRVAILEMIIVIQGRCAKGLLSN
jgi:hypothetical protein